MDDKNSLATVYPHNKQSLDVMLQVIRMADRDPNIHATALIAELEKRIQELNNRDNGRLSHGAIKDLDRDILNLILALNDVTLIARDIVKQEADDDFKKFHKEIKDALTRLQK